MDTFYVRLRHNKEPVGVFVCEEKDLFCLVDEITSPYDCEYIVMTSREGFLFHACDWDSDEEEWVIKEAMTNFMLRGAIREHKKNDYIPWLFSPIDERHDPWKKTSPL